MIRIVVKFQEEPNVHGLLQLGCHMDIYQKSDPST